MPRTIQENMPRVCIPSQLGWKNRAAMFPGMFVRHRKTLAACSQDPQEAFLADSAFFQCPLKWSPALNSNCFRVLFKQPWHGSLDVSLSALLFNLFLIASQTPEFPGDADQVIRDVFLLLACAAARAGVTSSWLSCLLSLSLEGPGLCECEVE